MEYIFEETFIHVNKWLFHKTDMDQKMKLFPIMKFKLRSKIDTSVLVFIQNDKVSFQHYIECWKYIASYRINTKMGVSLQRTKISRDPVCYSIQCPSPTMC